MPGHGARAHRVAVGVLGLGLTGSSLIGATARATVPVAGTRAPSKLWQVRYDSGDTDQPLDMVVSPDGSTVYVVGTASNDALAVAYDTATGHTRWVVTYNDPIGPWAAAVAVALSPDGSSLFVAGSEAGSDLWSNDLTLALDAATGDQLWASTYSGTGEANDGAVAAAVSPDGATVYVTGYANDDAVAHSATIAYDAATGTQQWIDLYNGPNDVGYGAADLGLTPDGTTLIIAGTAGQPFSTSDFVTVGYDAATGTREWTSIYDGPAHGSGTDAVVALAVDPSGRSVVVTGNSSALSGFWDYATVAYDTATGAEQWVARYGPKGGYDRPTSIAAGPDGTVFVTGNAGADFGTAAYDVQSGAEVWAAQYQDEGLFHWATSLAVTADGRRLYVAGYTIKGGINIAWATVAYDAATGRGLGVIKTSPGEATDVAVSPDGSELFITGWAGAGSPQDIRTMAYRV